MPLENLFKKIFLCGIFDAIQETFYGKPEEEGAEPAGLKIARSLHYSNHNSNLIFSLNLEAKDGWEDQWQKQNKNDIDLMPFIFKMA